jgi:hypothetical protein
MKRRFLNFYFILFSSLIVVSCTEKVDNNLGSENLEPKSGEWDFMKVLVKDFPVSENSTFDVYKVNSDTTNYSSKRTNIKLSKDQVRKLGLEKWLQNSSEISINYELPYSDDFRAFVFTYQDGEMELKTMMVTFDSHFKKIDELQVAYDEIAESWLRTKSEISSNEIEVKEYNESSGETVVTISNYRIDKNGKFMQAPKG